MHDINLVTQAIDRLLVDDREMQSAEKAEQYGAKSSFYPSELGSGDRKIVYGFFKDELIEKTSLSGQNVRVFDNGDYVHLRYRDYMLRLGALLSDEQRIKIEQNDFERSPEPIEGGWKISGRYDQIIDLNVIRAFLRGRAEWQAFLKENYEHHTVVTTVMDTTANALLEEKHSGRWFPKEGYEPDAMVIDVKSMSPWGFKAIEKMDYSDIQGYLDQVSAYSDKLQIYKGGLLIEDKEKNRLAGVPVDYDEARIVGGGIHEGLSARLGRLWEHVKNRTIPAERCEGANVSKFPCKWSTGQCDFFSHCWNDEHGGTYLPSVEVVEEEPELPTIDELVEYLTNPDYQLSAIILYLQDFPGGQDRFVVKGDMPKPLIEQMLDYYADYVHNLDYVDIKGNIQGAEEEQAEAVQEVAAAASEEGQQVIVADEDLEYQPETASKAPKCTECGEFLIGVPEDPRCVHGHEQKRYTKTQCSACGSPQYMTESGITCDNGHGGAEPFDKEFSKPLIDALKDEEVETPPPGNDELINEKGEFNFEPTNSSAVIERIRQDGQKEINCGKCNNLIIYKVRRGPKTCPTCNHKNVIHREA